MNNRAFSLVEISIVLVIVGLLTGGIIGGRALIRNGELKAVVNDVSTYTAAFTAFQQKYGQRPGDMTNATDYWGAISTVVATCNATANTGQATCNGNGGGFVNSSDSNVTYNETWHAWKQMANEGLISGTYNGVAGSGSNLHCVPGTNVPEGPLDYSAFSIWGTIGGSTGSYFTFNRGNHLLFGAISSTSQPANPIFTAEETWSIDSKMDDGLPGTGTVHGTKDTACSTTTTASTALYNRSSSSTGCAMTFQMDIED